MSLINFMLNRVEREQSFIISIPGQDSYISGPVLYKTFSLYYFDKYSILFIIFSCILFTLTVFRIFTEQLSRV